MPDKILHKRNLTTGNIPTTASLEPGELAINVADGKLFLRQSGSVANQIVTVGLSASYATTAATASYVNTLNQDVLISGSLKFDQTQDPDPTGLDLDSTIFFQSSSNTALGYDLYIRQNGNLVKWKWIEGIVETGLLYGGVVTYSGSNVFVSPGSGIIVDHNATTGSEVSPVVEYVTWNAITQSITNIATRQVTYLYIDSTGALQQQSTRFTSQQYHNYIPLGAVGHFDYTQVSAFGGAVQTAYDQISQMSNFVDAFGPLKISGYGLTGQSGSLRLSVGSGTSFIHGGFYENDPEFPSQITTPAQATASLARVYRSGSAVIFDTNAGNLYTVVNPTVYDRDGDGILHSVGSGNWSIQRVFSDPKTGVLYVYYGQARYTTLLNALQYLPTDPFTEGDTFDFTTFLGYLVLRGNASDLTDTNNNSIINGGLFRGSGQGSGGGIALSNLDDLTDVSITGPADGEALIYNAGVWQNGVPTSASYASTASYILQAVSSSFATTASYAVSASYAVQALSASWAPTPYGAFGIANSSGSYTYYTTFSASIAAATSGQTVEMFADRTETGSVTVTLKNGVNINGNGHTYTLNNSGGPNAFSLPSSATCFIFDAVLRILNSSGSLMVLGTNSTLRGNAILYGSGSTSSEYAVTTTSTIPANISGFTIITEGAKNGIFLGNGSFGDNLQIYSNTGIGLWIQDSAQVRNSNIYATNPSTRAVYVQGGLLYSMVYSGGANAGNAIHMQSSNNTTQPRGIYNCDVKSLTGHGVFMDNPMDLEDCKITTYGTNKNALAFDTNATTDYTDVHKCVLRSINGACVNQVLRWVSFTDCYLYAGAGSGITNSFNNSTFNVVRLRDSYVEVAHNSNASHGVLLSNSTLHEISDCYFSLANSGSYALKAQGSTTAKYLQNSFTGSAVPVDPNISQGMINTQDNFGNIII